MIFELLNNATSVTDVNNSPDFFPTNHPHKTFQVNVQAVGATPAALATATAASLNASVKVMVSNDGQNWFEHLAEIQVNKPAGQATAAAKWAVDDEMWGYYMPVVTAIDAGLAMNLFMAIGKA